MPISLRRAPLALLLPILAAARLGGAPAPPKKTAAPRPRVVVVAWDGADWKLLDPLMKAGRMPSLSRLLARGRSWDLTSFNPMVSPLLWTSVATGRAPMDHGVCDFQELEPKTRARLPISSRSRKVPALWNVASAGGLKVGVVNWWATWPAEKVNGFLVSDRAAPVLFDPESLSRSPAVAWPEGLAEGVRIVVKREGSPSYEDVAKALRISRAEFDAAVASGKDLEDPITGYRKMLGVTRITARIAVDLYDRQKPDLLMAYFQATDEVGHVLARYHPPRLSTVSEEEFQKFSGGVAALYEEADRILGELAARAERDGATFVLLSDHGFKWGDDRPKFYSGTQFDTAFLWHRSPGILVAAGPGVTPSPSRERAHLFDVAPTLTRLLGLPADPAFEGKPVAGLGPFPGVKQRPPASWEKSVKVERLAARASTADEKKAADEFTKKLISLGYITGAEASAVDSRPPDRAGMETAGHFANIGTYLREAGKPAESVPWYKKALEVNPRSPTTWFNLSVSLLLVDRWDESDDTLIASLRVGNHDPEATVFRRFATYTQRIEKKPKARAQRVAFLRKVSAAYPDNDRYRTALGKVLLEEKECTESEKLLREVVGRRPAEVDSINALALAAWCLGRTDEVRTLFRRSLEIDPQQPAIREDLAELERGGKTAP